MSKSNLTCSAVSRVTRTNYKSGLQKHFLDFFFRNLMGQFSSRIIRSSNMASVEIQQFIKEAVAQDKVVVFSKSYCPYCKLAKDVFNQVKQPIKVYELDERDDGAHIQDNLASITGLRTVPQVFINGNCVGGGSDVKKLLDSGKLEPMLIG